MATVVTNTGKGIVTNRLKGAGTEPVNVGWGTGAGTAAATDTTLFTEALVTLAAGTSDHTAGTSTQQTTTTTSDTYQVVATQDRDRHGDGHERRAVGRGVGREPVPEGRFHRHRSRVRRQHPVHDQGRFRLADARPRARPQAHARHPQPAVVRGRRRRRSRHGHGRDHPLGRDGPGRCGRRDDRNRDGSEDVQPHDDAHRDPGPAHGHVDEHPEGHARRRTWKWSAGSCSVSRSSRRG
jgi:hypothetical protein